jgi:hypothetical protein
MLAAILVVTGAWQVFGRDQATEVPVARLDREAILCQLKSADVTAVTATYIDGSATVAEMAAGSKLIAVVQVTSRAQYSPVAVAVTATVTRVIKGEAPKEEIVIFQLGNLGFIQQMRQVSRLSDGKDGLLNEREYLLFLGKQDDGQPHTFFIRGGMQGIFYAEGDYIVTGDTRFAAEISRAGVTGGLSALEAHVKSMLKGR